ncbi:unnamed protein product [Urochloa humidicola]
MATTPPSASRPIIIRASCLDRSPTTTSLPAPNACTHHLSCRPSPVPLFRATDGDEGIVRPPRRKGPRAPAAMSHHLGRVVFTWARKESSAAAEPGSSSRPAKSRRQQEGTNNNNGGGARRWGRLDIVQAVRKYVSMVEQLIFASYSGGSGGSSRDVDGRRRRPHTFTYARGGGAASSKRHKGRLSSAPASLRGSPASSGHLAVGESVVMTKASTSSEVSTMEELHSAIQAAIAHCKSSAAAAAAAAGDGDSRQ